MPNKQQMINSDNLVNACKMKTLKKKTILIYICMHMISKNNQLFAKCTTLLYEIKHINTTLMEFY